MGGMAFGQGFFGEYAPGGTPPPPGSVAIPEITVIVKEYVSDVRISALVDTVLVQA